MHPARLGTVHKISDRFFIIEHEDTLEFQLGVDRISLDFRKAVTIRNLISNWNNARANRLRRATSNDNKDERKDG